MAGEIATIYRDALRGPGIDTVTVKATDGAGQSIQRTVDVIVGSTLTASYTQSYQLKGGDVGPIVIGTATGVDGAPPYAYGDTP